MKKYSQAMITSILFLIVIVGILYYYPRHYKPKDFKVSAVTAKTEISPGDKIILNENVEIKEIYLDDKVDNTISNIDGLNDYIAIEQININEQITNNRILHKDKLLNENETYIEIPVNIGALVAGEVSTFDYVNVWVNLKNRQNELPPQIVFSKVQILKLKDVNGNDYIERTNNLPSYAIIKLTDGQIKKLKSAQRDGEIFLSKYQNALQPSREEEYIPTWAKTK